jgi:hypothetical protein
MIILDDKKVSGFATRAKSAWARGMIWWHYQKRVRENSDIHEHLPYLRELAQNCESICEMGVRRCVSSWAFLLGLAESPRPDKALFCVDIQPAELHPLIHLGAALLPAVQASMTVADSRSFHLPREVDLLFIDTLHVYGQLKQELSAHQARVRSFLCLHDTETDGEEGEVVRMGWDVQQMATETGLTPRDLRRGLRPAIQEFLEAFPQWQRYRHFPNNNGLTVLRRRNT